jgi:hypothetical protein
MPAVAALSSTSLDLQLILLSVLVVQFFHTCTNGFTLLFMNLIAMLYSSNC